MKDLEEIMDNGNKIKYVNIIISIALRIMHL